MGRQKPARRGHERAKSFFFFLCTSSEGLEVLDALVQRLLLQVGRDALANVANDPVDHVLMLEPACHVVHLHLVVEAALDLR